MKRLLILPILPVLHAGTQHIPDTPCSAKRDRAVADQECACCLQIPKTLQMALDSPGTLHSLSPTPISVHETQFGSYSTMSSQCRHLLVQVCLWPVERKLCRGAFCPQQHPSTVPRVGLTKGREMPLLTSLLPGPWTTSLFMYDCRTNSICCYSPA